VPMLAVAAVVATLAVAPARSPGPLEDVGYVTAQADAALRSTSDYVVHSTAGNGTMIDSWSDEKAGQRRTDSYTDGGQLVEAAAWRADPPTTTRVSVTEHTWWTAPANTPDTVDPDTTIAPDVIRRWLHNPHVRMVGVDSVAGHRAAHLEITAISNAPGGRADLWVDAETYLLLRERITVPGLPVSTTDFAWLPRTTENVARCGLSVPAGFTRVASPYGAPPTRPSATHR